MAAKAISNKRPKDGKKHREFKTSPGRTGTKQRREAIDPIRVRVWFCFLRMLSADWDDPTTIARKVEKDKCKKKDGGGWEVPRPWYWYAIGSKGPSLFRLMQVERYFLGSMWLYLHDFWRLLRKKPPTGDDLLAIIRRLPPRYLSYLLEDPDPVTGETAIKYSLTLADVEAVQRLGHLDALAALLALYLLAVERHDSNARELAGLCGYRLFFHITSFQPFILDATEIWEIAMPRFFSDQVDTACREYQGRVETSKDNPLYRAWVDYYSDCLDVVAACERLGVIGHDQSSRMEILFIAEKIGLSAVSKAAFSYDLALTLRDPNPKIEPALQELINRYQAKYNIVIPVKPNNKRRPPSTAPPTTPEQLLDQALADLERNLN